MTTTTRLGIASGSKTMTALVGDAPRRGRPARPDDHRAQRARHRPAADRRRRDGRAPARAPLRHRRLPRRGRARLGRLPDAGVGAPPGDDRRLPADPRRAPDQVPGRRAVLLLQRRVRRARAHRRARRRPLVPRPRPRARARARRHGGQRLLAHRRPAGHGRDGVRRGRRTLADQRLPPARPRAPATAACSPPPATSHGSGAPCSTARSSRPRRSRRCSATAVPSSRTGAAATAWASGCGPAPARSPSWAPTPASRSPSSTTRRLGYTHTVIANTSDGAWPVSAELDAIVGVD